MIKNTLLFFLLCSSAFAKNYLDENLKKMNWNGVDVIWLEDSSLPTYDVSIYFREGALGDSKKYMGETELMFHQLSSGTNRYTQSEIVEALEFYGASYGSRVTHEYSTFSVGGLVKDIVPTMKMICHMFDNAKFPKKELKKAKSRIISGFKSSVTDHSSLASKAFRHEALKGSGFENPTTGNIKTIGRIGSKRLEERLKYFNKSALKRIYIKGPNDINQLESIFKNDCNWTKATGIREIPDVASYRNIEEIIFVPVPKANQAQVRIGRIISSNEVKAGKNDLKSFASNYLGSGFTSVLFQKLRVQKGLTYSVGTYVSDQYSYGRSGIVTFTKNETIVELLESIKESLNDVASNIHPEVFKRAKKSIKGNYLIGLESTSDFLSNLLHFDHVNRPYEDIYKFTQNIDAITVNDLQKMTDEIFGWKKQTVLVLGNKSLVKTLKKAGYKVKISKYSNYL